jgi:hypothetical protein
MIGRWGAFVSREALLDCGGASRRFVWFRPGSEFTKAVAGATAVQSASRETESVTAAANAFTASIIT